MAQNNGMDGLVALDAGQEDLIRDRVKELVRTVERSYFEVGGHLQNIARSSCFLKWGYPNFRAYVEGELLFEKRKAFYLIEIYDKTVRLGLDGNALESVGWSKAKEIIRVAKNKEQFEHWAAKARKMSLKELTKAIKDALGIEPSGPKTETNPVTGETLIIYKFALAQEQYDILMAALEIAGKITKSPEPSRQIELICLDFASHNSTISSLPEKIADFVNRNMLEIDESK